MDSHGQGGIVALAMRIYEDTDTRAPVDENTASAVRRRFEVG